MVRRSMVVFVSLAGCSAGPIDVAGSSLFDGLVAHWAFDEASGTVVRDSSGNVPAHDGTLIQGTTGTWIPGQPGFGGALHFGGGASITVPSFPNADENWSVALWVRPATLDFGPTYVTLISTEVTLSTSTTDPHPGGGWQMNVVTPTTGETDYQFGYWLGPEVGDYHAYDCACAVAGQWTHIAGVVEGVPGKLSFYANGGSRGLGVYSAGSTINKPILPGSPILYMGRWQGNARLFQGDLDDIVIYKRALTASEVSTLAHFPAPQRR